MGTFLKVAVPSGVLALASVCYALAADKKAKGYKVACTGCAVSLFALSAAIYRHSRRKGIAW